ncbi:bS18 family ribosomal protein [Streptomyces sp. NPDC059894]|uniref:bS18 family ribosomal protein n=1 Tax=unclassified Streptomyces TaxID=2593676 RepID=UPI00366A146F
MRTFLSDRGKIRSRRVTRVSARQQRQVSARSRTPGRWPSCRTAAADAEGGSGDRPPA